MTTPADDAAVEDAFEAYLAGRPVPEEAADLAVFAEAVRTTATAPGRPNAALAELLATGLLTDQSSPSTRTARSAGAPPSRGTSRTRNRRRFTMIFPVLIAKFLSAGAVAQAAAGAGVVLVAVTGVGAAGALPAPVQDTFSTVVATVTPLEAPTSEETGDETGDETTDETTPDETTDETTDETLPVTVPEDAEFDVEAWIEAGPEEDKTFGEWVSASAHNDELRAALRASGRNFGSVISQWAHNKGMSEEDLAADGVDLDELTDVTTEPAPEGETEVAEPEQDTEPQVAATERGNGKATDGNGSGKAKSNGNGGGKGNGRN
jgi:hypothetical protein